MKSILKFPYFSQKKLMRPKEAQILVGHRNRQDKVIIDLADR